MRKSVLIFLTVSSMLALGLPMAADDAKPKEESREQGKVKQQLIELEKEWTRTIVKNDADSIGPFMSDDWCIIHADGSVMDRSRFLSLIESGNVTHDLMELDDWRVRVYGDTGVVTSKGKSKGKYKGRAFSTYERSTSVYARIDGRWQCVLTQLTAIKKK